MKSRRVNRLRWALAAVVVMTASGAGALAADPPGGTPHRWDSTLAATPADATVRAFFACINRADYRAAYRYLAAALRQDIGLAEFTRHANTVRTVRVESLTVIDRDPHLLRLGVSARLVLKYEGRWYEALYQGTMNLVPAEGAWRVIEIDLSPTSQKPVTPQGRPGPRIDFGTR